MKYYLDAPGVVKRMAIVSIFFFAGSLLSFWAGFKYSNVVWDDFSVSFIYLGLFYFCNVIAMIITSYYSKPRLIKILINKHFTRKHATIIDVGIGSGLAGIIAASLPWKPKIIGIDIWSKKDQLNNSLQTLRNNCMRAGVMEQVEIVEADICKTNLPNQCGDLVISILCIHNISKKEDRCQALSEITRLIKPGGSLYIVDFKCINEYARSLEELGWTDIKKSRYFMSLFPPVRILSATYPGSLGIE